MPAIQSVLSIGQRAFETVGIIIALLAVWAWVEVLLSSFGSLTLFGEALTWTALALLSTLPTAVIRRVRGRVADTDSDAEPTPTGEGI